jgi:uncharacterized protein YqjF (DUF2071 family)
MTRRDVDWRGVTDEHEHRPWPLPERPWRMTMTWSDLLFAHWPVDAAVIAEKLPAGLEVDTFDGRAWIGVIPFRMDNTGVRRLPSPPALATFTELNVRTYVRATTGPERPGVWFFSLDATSRIAVEGARALFHLPYFKADMSCEGDDEWTVYRSRRTDSRLGEGEFNARYRPVGAPRAASPGSLEHWLTERYCLYSVDGKGRISRADVHHAQWPLRDAEAEIAMNTVCDAHGIDLGDPLKPALLHFAPMLHVVGWLPERL